MIGQVRSYDGRKRYGYIMGDDGKEYFFHKSEIRTPAQSIGAGEQVQFATKSGYPKPQALGVSLL